MEAESQFIKVIRSRIVSEARRTIQGKDFDSVAQLTNYLKQIYDPSKTVYQLQGELGSVYQKNEEDVDIRESDENFWKTYIGGIQNFGKYPPQLKY